MAMEFWGAEVKAGEPLKVPKEEGTLLHLSQASLGEVKKASGNESVVLYVTIDGKKIVLGTLSSDKFPQIAYDLVFEKDFELSHNWKNGSVHFCGYRAEMDEGSENEDSDMFGSDESEEEEEEIPLAVANGKPEPKADKPKASADKAKAAKPDSPAKSKVKGAKPVIDEDDSDDEDDDSEEGESDDEDMLVDDDESDEDDDEESDEEEDTPKNAKQSKKRPSESAAKTPAPEKKAKLVTPQKSGGEKKSNSHTATPHPSKQAGKADKSKQQTPKSAGQVVCKSCSKTFNSDGALQSHTKAKHSDAK